MGINDGWEMWCRFFSFSAISVSASMNLVVIISLVCLDRGSAFLLIHCANLLLRGRWWWLCLSALVPCRYRPPTFHVQAWYDEVKDYSFPYPQECNTYCPFKCSGPVCTHYTQVTTHGLYHSIYIWGSFRIWFWSPCCSWFGLPAVGSAVLSTCVTTWMFGARFGPKPSILSATIHQSKQMLNQEAFNGAFIEFNLRFK